VVVPEGDRWSAGSSYRPPPSRHHPASQAVSQARQPPPRQYRPPPSRHHPASQAARQPRQPANPPCRNSTELALMGSVSTSICQYQYVNIICQYHYVYIIMSISICQYQYVNINMSISICQYQYVNNIL